MPRRPSTVVIPDLSVSFNSVDGSTLLREFEEGALYFHNIDTVGKLFIDNEFAGAARRAEWNVIDGQILRWLMSLLARRRLISIAGSDFLGMFCRHHAGDASVRVFLLGAGPGVADRARSALNGSASRDVVVGAYSPSFGFDKDPEEESRLIDVVQRSGASVLVVGVGAPRQEVWIDRIRPRLPEVARFIAVGAAIDFESGEKPRAPGVMSKIGLEWLFRLLTEPRRLWRRYLVEGPIAIWRLTRANWAERNEEAA